MVMNITIQIHLEAANNEAVWWAESDELPGASAAADTLSELRASWELLLKELSEERGEAIEVVSELLVGAVEEAAQSSDHVSAKSSDEALLTRPASPTRQVLIAA
jgi:predicted RNase H-like HicB family nuclease